MQINLTEASVQRSQVAAFMKERRQYKTAPQDAVNIARRLHGSGFAEAVTKSYASSAGSNRAAYLESQRLYRQRLKESGIEPVRIPSGDKHMRAAVGELFDHADEGRKPSAKKAASQPGLNAQQIQKLAYRVPLKKDLIQDVVDLRADSPFVKRLLEDTGMTGIVVAGQINLSKMAHVLSQANQSLAQRVERLEAAVILLAGEIQADRDTGNSRGNWHPQALALQKQGKTMNQIARLLGRKPGTVKKVLSRNAKRELAE